MTRSKSESFFSFDNVCNVTFVEVLTSERVAFLRIGDLKRSPCSFELVITVVVATDEVLYTVELVVLEA